jgi:hypothetical protein
MKSRTAVLTLFLCVVSTAQIQQRQQLSGLYFTPSTLRTQMNNAATEKTALAYLMGAYDLTQDSGQSCAQRGTTTPVLLEQVFNDYLQAHPEVIEGKRTAAGVAADAFSNYWPCQRNNN